MNASICCRCCFKSSSKSTWLLCINSYATTFCGFVKLVPSNVFDCISDAICAKCSVSTSFASFIFT